MNNDESTSLDVFRTEAALPIGHIIETAQADYRVVKTLPHPGGGFQSLAEPVVLYPIDIETGKRLKS
ncbi:hypothetical protein CY658_05030 [Variovorax sp. RO1]|uniref:hypothetical protein n=1 Tax=Variovorax sp. RO1 TaxID=2066034 RepID=UPI000CC29702|nr:hypothetical protein [Variovorax sp. RO1]PLC06401.1 hypothetical protein CY658_05030 [Variovorax sp. RO1]